jgi:hypothetical protein
LIWSLGAPFSFHHTSGLTFGSHPSHCSAAVSIPNRSKKTYCDGIPPPFNSPSGHRRGQMRFRHWRRRQRSQFFDVPDYFPVRETFAPHQHVFRVGQRNQRFLEALKADRAPSQPRSHIVPSFFRHNVSLLRGFRVAALILFVRNFVPVAVRIFHIAMHSPVIPIETLSNIDGIIKRADFPTENLVVHILRHFHRT